MKRKLFLTPFLLLGALAIGFQTAQAQEPPSDDGMPPDAPVPIEERLIKVCLAAEEMNDTQPPTVQQTRQDGVIVFLPGTTNLVTLSAYSAFCSVEQDQPLLGDCQCGGTPQPQ
jgi:hypothetical protein